MTLNPPILNPQSYCTLNPQSFCTLKPPNPKSSTLNPAPYTRRSSPRRPGPPTASASSSGSLPTRGGSVQRVCRECAGSRVEGVWRKRKRGGSVDREPSRRARQALHTFSTLNTQHSTLKSHVSRLRRACHALGPSLPSLQTPFTLPPHSFHTPSTLSQPCTLNLYSLHPNPHTLNPAHYPTPESLIGTAERRSTTR